MRIMVSLQQDPEIIIKGIKKEARKEMALNLPLESSEDQFQ